MFLLLFNQNAMLEASSPIYTVFDRKSIGLDVCQSQLYTYIEWLVIRSQFLWHCIVSGLPMQTSRFPSGGINILEPELSFAISLKTNPTIMIIL